MDSHFLTSSTSLQAKCQRYTRIINRSLVHKKSTKNFIKFKRYEIKIPFFLTLFLFKSYGLLMIKFFLFLLFSFFCRIKYNYCYSHHQQQKKNKLLVTKASTEKARTDLVPVEVADEKEGTIAGAVALIIGTSIGSGILALPQKAAPAVNYPSLFVSFT